MGNIPRKLYLYLSPLNSGATSTKKLRDMKQNNLMSSRIQSTKEKENGNDPHTGIVSVLYYIRRSLFLPVSAMIFRRAAVNSSAGMDPVILPSRSPSVLNTR